MAAVLSYTSVAEAAPLKYFGTTVSFLGTLPRIVFTGTGIATVNASSGGYGHLNAHFASNDVVGTQTVVVTDPEVTIDGIISIRAQALGGGGTFWNISGGGPLQQDFVSFGISKVCLYDPNCLPGSFLPLGFSEHKTASTTIGIGIGGVQTIGGVGLIRISLINNPYTLATAAALDQTDNGDIVTKTLQGFAHGPASLTSSTALPSGVVQFVTPTQVTTNLTAGSAELQSLLAYLRVHYVPEPGFLLLIGSGVAGLIVLGRQRMKR